MPTSHLRGVFRKVVCLLSALCFTTAPASVPAQPSSPSTPYIMGVFPFVPAASVEGIFAPLAAELSRASGRQIVLKTPASFEKFMEELKSRHFDIAFIQPFDYVNIAKPNGYLPVAARNDTLTSHIVVRQNSPIKRITDLKGKSLGMPPKVAAVSYMNRYAIKKAGLKPDVDVKFVYFSSHQACLQQLVIGNVAACGVSAAGVRLVEHQLKTSFRLIYETPDMPTPLFVVKKEMDKNDQQAIATAIIATNLTGVKPELRQMFIGETMKPFRASNDRDYDVVRKYMKMTGAQ